MARVLVVEDDLSVLLATALGVVGQFDVDIAETGEEAILRTQRCEYDAVVMDLLMPGMGGLAAIRTIRSTCPNLPILVLTAYGHRRIEAKEAGATEFLVKPIAIQDLIDRVRYLVRAQRMSSKGV